MTASPLPNRFSDPGGDDHADIGYPSPLLFVAAHLVCVAAFWTGVPLEALVMAAVLYVVRMFGVTAGYHRYFAHRTYQTSRAFQFVLACLAQSSAQRGVLWWAAKHRWHHRYADTELDVHSPGQHGFLYAHLGWMWVPRHDATDLSQVPDLAKFPELVWLDRHPYLAAAVLGVTAWLIGGWSGLVVGFFWSTVALWHATFCINSLAHVMGRRRYVTGDDSRNNWWLAILTLGEGWHNNHHVYPASVRQGFRWWQYDPTYRALRILSCFGLVWDLSEPPERLVQGEQRLGPRMIDKVARQLAASVGSELFLCHTHAILAARHRGGDPRALGAPGASELVLRELHLRRILMSDQIRRIAKARLAPTPWLDEIVHRTWEIALEGITERLLGDFPPRTPPLQPRALTA